MTALIGFGITLTALGLGLLIWCIVSVMRAKRAGLDDDMMKAKLQKAVMYNAIAMGLSGLGLAALVVGLIL